MPIYLFLMLAAFVLSLLQSFQFWVRPRPRPHLGWLALALYFLGVILTGAIR
jgi:hypothetical protein